MCGYLWQAYQNRPQPRWIPQLAMIIVDFLQLIRPIGTESAGDHRVITWSGIGAIGRREFTIQSFPTEKTRYWPARWLGLTLTDQTTNITGDSRGDASYFPVHLATDQQSKWHATSRRRRDACAMFLCTKWRTKNYTSGKLRMRR